MRFLLNHSARRSGASKTNRETKSVLKDSMKALNSIRDTETKVINTNNNLWKSWGQRCSPSCGCVLRFETDTDERQYIVDCNYVAKSVVATIDEKNCGCLTPVHTTRLNKPMFQECECQSLHTLAKLVTSYLPNKRWNHIQGMNEYKCTRSSVAFRHAVLSEHDLPRTDTHCFDIVEEALSGMLNGNVPSKRRINLTFEKVLAAECLQRPPMFQHSRMEGNFIEDGIKLSQPDDQIIENGIESVQRRQGVYRNRICMSTSKTIASLGIFDINAEIWSEEDECNTGKIEMDSKNNNFDWVSYVDELNTVNDSV